MDFQYEDGRSLVLYIFIIFCHKIQPFLTTVLRDVMYPDIPVIQYDILAFPQKLGIGDPIPVGRSFLPPAVII